MILKYQKQNGTMVEVQLDDKPLTIGRSPKADIVVDDERASRLHCGIRFLDGGYMIKDLASKNGTYLNEERIEAEGLKPGDKIRVGNSRFSVESKPAKGATTAIHEVEQQLSEGKGYKTILKEIVGES